MGLFNQSIKPLDYEFECVTNREYKLIMYQLIKRSMFSLLFSQLTNHASMIPTENKDEYEVPEKYYKMIYSTAAQSFKQIKTELIQDKIEIGEGHIKKALLAKQSQDWLFTIEVLGEYHDRS